MVVDGPLLSSGLFMWCDKNSTVEQAQQEAHMCRRIDCVILWHLFGQIPLPLVSQVQRFVTIPFGSSVNCIIFRRRTSAQCAVGYLAFSWLSCTVGCSAVVGWCSIIVLYSMPSNSGYVTFSAFFLMGCPFCCLAISLVVHFEVWGFQRRGKRGGGGRGR